MDPNNCFVKINVTAPIETPSWSKLLEVHRGGNHQSIRKRPGITLQHATGMRNPIVGSFARTTLFIYYVHMKLCQFFVFHLLK